MNNLPEIYQPLDFELWNSLKSVKSTQWNIQKCSATEINQKKRSTQMFKEYSQKGVLEFFFPLHFRALILTAFFSIFWVQWLYSLRAQMTLSSLVPLSFLISFFSPPTLWLCIEIILFVTQFFRLVPHFHLFEISFSTK